MVADYEDVVVFFLLDECEVILLVKQIECTFMWTNVEDDVVGVIMNYLVYDGCFWLIGSGQCKCFVAFRCWLRVLIVVISCGIDIGISQSLIYKGDVVFYEDDEIKVWFYVVLVARVRFGNAEQQVAFVVYFDLFCWVIIEVVFELRIGFDVENMFKGSVVGVTRMQV